MLNRFKLLHVVSRNWLSEYTPVISRNSWHKGAFVIFVCMQNRLQLTVRYIGKFPIRHVVEVCR